VQKVGESGAEGRVGVGALKREGFERRIGVKGGAEGRIQ
jgi:hypothetical protein